MQRLPLLGRYRRRSRHPTRPARQRRVADQDGVNRFLASPDGSGRQVDDRFAALGFAGPTKAPPLATTVAPREWLAWVDVCGTEFDRDTTNDLNGTQVNAIGGVTRRLTPDLLVGVLGGYEHFDYSSQALAGTLKGDGWTAGGFVGWRFAPNLRFDAAGAWSDILANDTAGSATGKFTGNRWLVSGGVTGTYGWQAWVLEPSARVYALWEHDNAFTDSLGTAQPAENFATGRVAAGLQASYPIAWASAVSLSPYAGIYGDYYFSSNDTAGIVITTVPLLQGFGVRATGGVTATFAGGAQLSAGGEFEEVGNATHIWTWRVRGYLPF